jgi:hypothetical protein
MLPGRRWSPSNSSANKDESLEPAFRLLLALGCLAMNLLQGFDPFADSAMNFIPKELIDQAILTTAGAGFSR